MIYKGGYSIKADVGQAEAMIHTGITLTATYDVRLVALSIVLAVFGSYIALDLAGQILVTQGWVRKLWLSGGTLALGISIWAMHFIAMLAYQLPIPIVYDFRIVFVSMAIAIAGAGASIFLVSRKQPLAWLPLIGGSIGMGLTIVGLHLAAMSSMRVAAISVYDPKLMALSIATAIVGSGSALGMAFHTREQNWLTACGRKIGSTSLLATAIIGMHYLAMAAVRFQPTNQVVQQPSPAINNSWLAVVVGVATLIVLILTLIASFFGQRSSANLARAEALRQSEERFRSLVQNTSDVIAIITADCTLSYLSPSFKRILGYEPEAWLGKKSLELVHFEDITKVESVYHEAHHCPAVNLTTEFRLQHIDGQARDFEVVINNLLAEPSVAGIVVTGRDITERKQSEVALQESEKRYQNLYDFAPDTYFAIAADGTIKSVNQLGADFLGYRKEELIGKPALSILFASDQLMFQRWFTKIFSEKMVAGEMELRKVRKDNSVFWVRERSQLLFDEQEEPTELHIICRDITERKQAEAQLLHNAFHDPLTNLPNRALFMDRLERSLNQAKRQEDYLVAVLFLDLDRFKVVNDSLGHTFGDQLLITIADRLTTCLRPTDTAARLGGDEFTILLEGIKDISDAIKVADRIQTELKLPLILGEQEVFTTASIGIALSDKGYSKPGELLRDADIAMYRAKALSKARYEIFNADMHIQAVARLQLENDLRRAIERQEFQIYYQPIVSLKTGLTISFEALVRWQHPSRGLLSPTEFLAVVAETGLSVLVDQWVLKTACHQMHQWQQEMPADPPISICINFCSQHFTQPNLIEQVDSILKETGLNAQSLKLELTENVILENDQSVREMLLQLKALGIKLAIDDFGTGYSSLGRLRSFPLNILKIDRSFISDAGIEISNLDIVGTIIALAHSLGMDVTAEGVETAQQLAQLKELNCEYGQGYFFSEPLDTKATKALIMAKPQWGGVR